MENTSYSPEQLPSPIGLPIPVEHLGNLPANPALRESVNLVGSDESRLLLLENNTASTELIDAGMLDLAPIGKMVDSTRIAYHGIKYSIARVREDRADARVKNMDRKDDLYEDTINNLSTPGVATEKPQTVVDRFMSKRLERKASKHARTQKERDRIRKIYSTNATKEVVSTTVGIKGKINTLDNVVQAKLDYRSGNMTYSEMRTEIAKIKANPKKYENQSQRKSRKKVEHTENSYDRATEQPISSRWRAIRRYTSGRSSERHFKRAEKHLQKAKDLKSSRP